MTSKRDWIQPAKDKGIVAFYTICRKSKEAYAVLRTSKCNLIARCNEENIEVVEVKTPKAVGESLSGYISMKRYNEGNESDLRKELTGILPQLCESPVKVVSRWSGDGGVEDFWLSTSKKLNKIYDLGFPM